MRSFGTEISANRRPISDLSPELYSAIISGLESQQSPSVLPKRFHVDRSTIYRTKNRFYSTKSLETGKRAGLPKKLSFSEQRYIYLLARRKPKMSWNGLIANTDPEVSKSTIRRVLKRFDLRKWKSKKRIPLKEDAKNRLHFARL
jgi:transposase